MLTYAICRLRKFHTSVSSGSLITALRPPFFYVDQSVKSTAGPTGGKKCEDGEEELDNDAVCHQFCSAYTASDLEGSPCRGFFCHGSTAPSGQGQPHYRGFTITHRYTTLTRTPLDE